MLVHGVYIHAALSGDGLLRVGSVRSHCSVKILRGFTARCMHHALGPFPVILPGLGSLVTVQHPKPPFSVVIHLI